jgi:hypothetical protein
VSEFRGELRDFRQAVASSFNALREDMNDRFARVDEQSVLCSGMFWLSVLTESGATFASNLGHSRQRRPGVGYDNCTIQSRMDGMTKAKVSVTIDQAVLAAADADAYAAGLIVPR